MKFIATEVLKSGAIVAWMSNDFELPFRINKNTLLSRIEYRKTLGYDISEEQNALKALEEQNK